MTKILFPNEPISEWTVCRPFTAPGLFAYRHLQADGLLHFPDYGEGELNSEQRREALDRAVTLHRPLTALIIFLNVVALEDFIRDLGARLASIDGLSQFFPKIDQLKLGSIPSKQNKLFARLDKDPIPNLLDFKELNKLYDECIGVQPISETEFPRLYDLTLVRHTVAHNGAIFRQVDVPRFQYYNITPNQIINPPPKFVKDTCSYLYKTGRNFEECVRSKVISEVMPQLDKTWPIEPPDLLLSLIEVFNFFGKIVTSSGFEKDSQHIHDKLVRLCLDELKEIYVIK